MRDICIITDHCCIRVFKQAYVLSKIGYRLHLIAGKNWKILSANDQYVDLFESITLFTNKNQLDAAIRAIGVHTNIYHIHNEPSTAVAKVRSIYPKSKIILDVHDSQYWREDARWVDEDVAIGIADGFIVPSVACRGDLAGRTSKPIAYCPSAVPYDWYIETEHKACGGMVSEGGHNTDGSWRDYTDLYDYLKNKDIQIYACSPQFTNDISDSSKYNITQHYGKYALLSNLPYHNMLQLMGSSDWSLVGNWRNNGDVHKVWKYAFPNKFFDSIAAGVPIVNFNVASVSKAILDYNVGISCDHPDDLIKRWDEHLEKRMSLMETRKQLSMERFIISIENMYKIME